MPPKKNNRKKGAAGQKEGSGRSSAVTSPTPPESESQSPSPAPGSSSSRTDIVDLGTGTTSPSPPPTTPTTPASKSKPTKEDQLSVSSSNKPKPGLFEPTYPRKTVVHGTPQVNYATGSEPIRPRTPSEERRRQYEEVHGIQGADVAAAPVKSRKQDEPPQERSKSVFYATEPTSPKSDERPKSRGAEHSAPVLTRTPSQGRDDGRADKKAAAGGEDSGGDVDDGDDDNRGRGGDGSPSHTLEQTYPEQVPQETEPHIHNITLREDAKLRTPSPERRQRSKETEAPEEDEKEGREKAAEGEEGKRKTPQSAEFDGLFAKPTERRYLGPDGKVPESISKAPILGGKPPPREKRKAKRERLAREFEEERQHARDRGIDPDAILAKTADVSRLLDYPIETKAQEDFRDYADEDDNVDKECVKLALAALDAENSAQINLVRQNLKLESAYEKQGEAIAPTYEALMSERAAHEKETIESEAIIQSLKTELAKDRRSSDNLTEEDVNELKKTNARLLSQLGTAEKDLANAEKQVKIEVEAAIKPKDNKIKQLEDQVQQLNNERDAMSNTIKCFTLDAEKIKDFEYQLDVANRKCSEISSKLQEKVEEVRKAEYLQEQLAKEQHGHSAATRAAEKLFAEKNGLNKKILELEEELGRKSKVLEDVEDAKSDRGQRSDSVTSENESVAHDCINFIILRVENALRTMVHERSLYGVRAGDTDVARAAAEEASDLADNLKDEALQGRAYFWYGVALYYASESKLASDMLAKAQDFTQWLQPLREKKWLAKWIDAANSMEVCKRKEDYWSPALYKHSKSGEQKKKGKKAKNPKGKNPDK